jgi:cytoskeletal protein CcmA (bactofilin family)
MWRKSNEVKPSEESQPATTPTRAKSEEPVKAPALPTPQAASSPAAPTPASASAPASSNLSKISSGLKIRGELSGDSDLYIDGDVEGKVRLTNGRVTVGPNGRVRAEIEARQICIEGAVEGNLKASENAQLGASSRVVGNVLSPRIGVADGAQLSGKVETAGSAKSSALETPEPENHRETVGVKLE